MIDERITGWNWVEGVLNFNALGISRTDPMTVRVELYADRTLLNSASNGMVLFNNICVEPLFGKLDHLYICMYVCILFK